MASKSGGLRVAGSRTTAAAPTTARKEKPPQSNRRPFAVLAPSWLGLLDAVD